VNHFKASVKSVPSEGDLPLFLACEIPEPSMDTIIILIKLYPELLCCILVVSIAKTMLEDLLSDSNVLSQHAMLLEKALEEIKELKVENADQERTVCKREEATLPAMTRVARSRECLLSLELDRFTIA
jgi:hypothetical protein